MSNGHRWSKFWWQDWQSDKALSRCSLAARGLWIELLCIAHEGEPYGHLRLNGHGLNAGEIADMITKTTGKEVARLLAELEHKGVFSRTDDGTIYSRRMQRDGKQSEVGRDAATRRWGGNGTSHPNGWPIGLPNGPGNGDATRVAITQPNATESDSESEAETKKVSKNLNLLNFSSVLPGACARKDAPDLPRETVAKLIAVETISEKVGRKMRNVEHGAAYQPDATIYKSAAENCLKQRPKAQPLVGEDLRRARQLAGMIQ